MRSCTILIRNAIVGMAVCYASSCIVVVRALSYNVPTSRSYNNGVDVSSTVANVDNPLMQQESLPKFSRIKPHHLTPAVESMLAKLQLDFYQLENALSSMNDDDDGIEYDQILPELERIKFALEYTWGVASHLTAVKNDNELRQAYETNQRKVVQAMAQFSQSKPLYSALLQLERKLEIIQDYDDSFLMRQKRRAVEKTLRSMKQGGVGLEVAKKERLNEIRMRLAALSTSFSNNMLDETQAFSITIYHSKTLRGVPESVKCLWHNAHRQFVARRSGNPSEFNKPLGFLSWGGNGPMSYEEELYEEEVGNFGWSMGPWRITLDQPSYLAAMMHIPERSLRQQICMAYLRRASETNPSKNNIPLINEMLQLKNEMANILGYGNYAELSISSKMASSVDYITKLTDLVAEKAIPVAQRELDEITAYAREHGGAEYAEETLKKLEPWDITYWTERLKESQFDLTEEEIRPYFALPSVLDGLFHLVDRLFDVSIQKGFAETWHTDVSFYNVFDNKSGLHIASFYFDPYARATNKRGGAWMSSCIGKSNAVNTDLPVAYVTCNTTPPHKGKPSLLTFREVQSLFHECGHALQHLLTKASVGDVSGINGIEVGYLFFLAMMYYQSYFSLTIVSCLSFCVRSCYIVVGCGGDSLSIHGTLVLRPHHSLLVRQTLANASTVAPRQI
jgi:oligopeptidase A